MLAFLCTLVAAVILSRLYFWFKADFANELHLYRAERKALKEQQKQIPLLKREYGTGTWLLAVIGLKAFIVCLCIYHGAI